MKRMLRRLFGFDPCVRMHYPDVVRDERKTDALVSQWESQESIDRARREREIARRRAERARSILGLPPGNHMGSISG